MGLGIRDPGAPFAMMKADVRLILPILKIISLQFFPWICYNPGNLDYFAWGVSYVGYSAGY